MGAILDPIVFYAVQQRFHKLHDRNRAVIKKKQCPHDSHTGRFVCTDTENIRVQHQANIHRN